MIPDDIKEELSDSDLRTLKDYDRVAKRVIELINQKAKHKCRFFGDDVCCECLRPKGMSRKKYFKSIDPMSKNAVGMTFRYNGIGKNFTGIIEDKELPQHRFPNKHMTLYDDCLHVIEVVGYRGEVYG
jgi:hypothetical protein